ncbi:Serine/threonine protein kinase OS=Tsukamurella paurometabola (strain ATCC 8368 / DSM / CCUG 35730 / CIP 100753 / JCM 10117 / KCTC 9821 / NBRC 16120 / NCIMB 702349 / NCTC 13040) OX=521096 GN=Tpau_0246 PE=4 SV=1 [Tsukamurella paurometabola]|nr:Predicted ATPase [Tsukamurella paurometabola]
MLSRSIAPEDCCIDSRGYFFYELPLYLRGGRDGDVSANRFSIPCSDEWTSVLVNGWMNYVPPDARLPDQGWKIHVSTVPSQAAQVLARVADVCLRRGLPFKHLPDMAAVVRSNAKYADRGGSGKFITIYPRQEDVELESLLVELEDQLASFVGPYILSDIRWRDSPVFLRYGGFRSRTAVIDGESVAVIRDDESRDVPDHRVPYFMPPSRSKIPEFLRDIVDSRVGGVSLITGHDFPYEVISAMHFANSGGVYLARHRDAPDTNVVLKEGRPHVAVDPATGNDAADRLLVEYNALVALRSVPGIVDAQRTFQAGGHRFVQIDFVDGNTLYDWVARNFPYPTTASVDDYVCEALSIANQVSEAVREAHRRGYALVDVQPRNIFVDYDPELPNASLRVTLIDLELAHSIFNDTGSPPPARFIGTPGFVSGIDDEFSAQQRDGYAVVRSIVHMFHPVTPLSSVSDTLWDGQKKYIRDVFGTQSVEAIERIDAIFGSPLQRSVARARAAAVRSAWLPSCSNSKEVRADLVTGILRSRTASRDDCVYPGSPAMYGTALGLASVGHGAAGVMLMLNRQAPCVRQRRVFVAELDQFQALYQSSEDFSLLTGRTGMACALWELGAPRESVSALVSGCAGAARRSGRYGLADGAGGIAAAVASICQSGGDSSIASEIAELADTLTAGPAVERALNGSPGLFDGMAGLAVGLLLLSLCPGVDAAALRSSGRTLVDAAVDTLVEAPDGSLHVRSRGALYPYLGSGSAGVGVAVAVMHQLTGEPLTADHVHVLHRVRRACHVRSCLYPGLLKGMSGLLVAERMFTELLGPPRTAMNPLELLAPFLFHSPSGLLSSGDGGRRLAVDYAHGAAGLLPALADSSHLLDWLPVANPHRLLSPRTSQPITIN